MRSRQKVRIRIVKSFLKVTVSNISVFRSIRSLFNSLAIIQIRILSYQNIVKQLDTFVAQFLDLIEVKIRYVRIVIYIELSIFILLKKVASVYYHLGGEASTTMRRPINYIYVMAYLSPLLSESKPAKTRSKTQSITCN